MDELDVDDEDKSMSELGSTSAVIDDSSVFWISGANWKEIVVFSSSSRVVSVAEFEGFISGASCSISVVSSEDVVEDVEDADDDEYIVFWLLFWLILFELLRFWFDTEMFVFEEVPSGKSLLAWVTLIWWLLWFRLVVGWMGDEGATIRLWCSDVSGPLDEWNWSFALLRLMLVVLLLLLLLTISRLFREYLFEPFFVNKSYWF